MLCLKYPAFRVASFQSKGQNNGRLAVKNGGRQCHLLKHVRVGLRLGAFTSAFRDIIPASAALSIGARRNEEHRCQRGCADMASTFSPCRRTLCWSSEAYRSMPRRKVSLPVDDHVPNVQRPRKLLTEAIAAKQTPQLAATDLVPMAGLVNHAGTSSNVIAH